MKVLREQSGTSLVEVLMTIAIFTMVTTALYSLIWISLHLVRDDQARLDGLALAQTRIEQLHNVPYDQVGTVGGVPEGAFAQSEVFTRNDRDYTVETDVRFVDDPFDGVAPTDTVNTDYKSVRVSVTWQGQYVQEPILLISTIAPEGIETSEGGGTLWSEVIDDSASPVVNATVHVTNDQVTPAIDITSATDASGRFILPGAPADVQSYHIEISKSGYSSDQTYPEDPVNNPNPDPQDLTVVETEITTHTFIIDVLSQLDIHIERRDDAAAIASLPFQLTGQKRIGTDLGGADIPEYDAAQTTDASGDVSVPSLAFDTYELVIDELATGYDVAGFSENIPLVLAPGTTQSITIRLFESAAFTGLVTVTDADNARLPDAVVHIYNSDLSVDRTETTDADGQVFFTPLTGESYTLDITSTGYAAYSTPVDITGDAQLTIPLSAE